MKGLGMISAVLGIAGQCMGWGTPHGAISRAAWDALPVAYQAQWGKEADAFARVYCIYPDSVYTSTDAVHYCQLPWRKTDRYVTTLHLPGDPQENYAIVRHLVGRITAAWRNGQLSEAASYSGVLAHAIEDWSCPAHVTVEDNMFTLFQQYLPPPETEAGKLLHSPLEGAAFTVDITRYQPVQLGTSDDAIAFTLLWHIQHGTVFARQQLVPMIEAWYRADVERVADMQRKAAEYGARLVADMLFSTQRLGCEKIEREQDSGVVMTSLFPLEAPQLYFPQRAFFSKPYWGYPLINGHMKSGEGKVALALQHEGRRVVVEGIGVGTASQLSYFLPCDLYQRFQAMVGLHADLGAEGAVTFSVFGNAALLKQVDVSGCSNAVMIDVPLRGVTNVQLRVRAQGKHPGTGNYAVWGNPRLLRD